ncbi:MAG TPA: type 1 glutamine amidotransferase domain-containing protein [Capsulimonadaceae bacterium]|nr:type 1 glutamine amidotransferase domain-containing protein [Capsulimonadaceae bacterium]
MAGRLDGKRIALFVEEGFEDSELTKPLEFLRAEGADVTLVGSGRQETFTGKGGTRVTPECEATEVTAEEFDAFVVPGGYAPEKMRMSPAMVVLIAEADDHGKIIAAICHGPQLLISADVLHDHMVTCYPSIAVDVRNSGANYVDEPVVCSGNIITSRTPDDIPDFNEAIVELLTSVVEKHKQPMIAGA